MLPPCPAVSTARTAGCSHEMRAVVYSPILSPHFLGQVLTPVRRSARKATPSRTPIHALLESTNYAYVPNLAVCPAPDEELHPDGPKPRKLPFAGEGGEPADN